MTPILSRLGAALALVVLLAALPMRAEEPADIPPEVSKLLDALLVPEMVQVMRAEGIDYGETLASDMIPGGATDDWRDTVSRIYDPARMAATVRQGFAASIRGTDLAPLQAFFGGDPGAELARLELSARRAMVAKDVEAAARRRFRDLEAEDDPWYRVIDRFVQVNDLVEANVAGGLNATMMFYRGLAAGGALELSEDEMIEQVWGQEAETRADTREWVYAFLMMAYRPAGEEAVAAFTALSETPEGQALNRALFAGFDQMYADISYALGLAAARAMHSQEL